MELKPEPVALSPTDPCLQYLAQIDEVVERLLSGPAQRPDLEDDDVMGHVKVCPRCMAIFSDVVELEAADDRWLSFPGLLVAWEHALEFRTRLADHAGAAAALGAISLILRQRDEIALAEDFDMTARQMRRTDSASAARPMGGASTLAALAKAGAALGLAAYGGPAVAVNAMDMTRNRDLPLTLLSPPTLHRDACLALTIATDEASYSTLPAVFDIAVTFQPLGQRLTYHVTPETRKLLLSQGGLAIRLKLHDVDDFAAGLGTRGEKYPPSACAFLIHSGSGTADARPAAEVPNVSASAGPGIFGVFVDPNHGEPALLPIHVSWLEGRGDGDRAYHAVNFNPDREMQFSINAALRQCLKRLPSLQHVISDLVTAAAVAKPHLISIVLGALCGAAVATGAALTSWATTFPELGPFVVPAIGWVPFRWIAGALLAIALLEIPIRSAGPLFRLLRRPGDRSWQRFRDRACPQVTIGDVPADGPREMLSGSSAGLAILLACARAIASERPPVILPWHQRLNEPSTRWIASAGVEPVSSELTAVQQVRAKVGAIVDGIAAQPGSVHAVFHRDNQEAVLSAWEEKSGAPLTRREDRRGFLEARADAAGVTLTFCHTLDQLTAALSPPANRAWAATRIAAAGVALLFLAMASTPATPAAAINTCTLAASGGDVLQLAVTSNQDRTAFEAGVTRQGAVQCSLTLDRQGFPGPLQLSRQDDSDQPTPGRLRVHALAGALTLVEPGVAVTIDADVVTLMLTGVDFTARSNLLRLNVQNRAAKQTALTLDLVGTAFR